MSANIIWFQDYERKSRNPDAVNRDLCNADVIILPVVRIERADQNDPHAGISGFSTGFNWPRLSPY
jgi:hypothetical protein